MNKHCALECHDFMIANKWPSSQIWNVAKGTYPCDSKTMQTTFITLFQEHD